MKYLIRFLLRFIPRKILQLFSHTVLRAIAPFYWGNKYYCPIEQRGYRKFLPYGRLQSRSNTLCPGSLSLERHRLLWRYLKEKTNFFSKSQKVLHIAPEICFIRAFAKQHKEKYITADLESPLAKVKMDIHHIPFEENTFDIAICNHVMEHVEDDIKAMGEIYRVLKPDGWAIIQVPFFYPLKESTYEDATITDPRDRESAFGQADHVRMYGKDYGSRLERVGFRVTVDDFVKTLPEDEIIKMGLSERELIYFCEKV